MSLVDATLVRDMQGALRRLRKGKLVAHGTEDDNDEGAGDVVEFLTSRCGWQIQPAGSSTGAISVGTGAGDTTRQAVLQNIYDALTHGDDLARSAGLPPSQEIDDLANLVTVMREAHRQIAMHGRPLPHQARAVAHAAVRLLERESEDA